MAKAKLTAVPANRIPRYRTFVQARDKALELLHSRAQMRTTAALAGSLKTISQAITHRYGMVPPELSMTVFGNRLLNSIYQLITHEFAKVQAQAVSEIKALRRRSMVLTRSSETEALGRTLGKPLNYKITRQMVDAIENKPAPSGGDVRSHVALALRNLKNKILHAVELAKLQKEPVSDLHARLKKIFPKLRRFKKVKQVLHPLLKEAKKDYEPETFSFGMVEPDVWQDMVDDYLDAYDPDIRDPELYFDVVGPELEAVGIDEGEWMGWEIEQLMTNDFVETVRDGQNDAANEQGITDMAWITVFGPTTCEGCQWRNGLTSSEIEAKLEDEESGDDYDASVPPAHASCRCQCAPMVDDLPDEAPEGLGDFSEWLT